MIIIQIQFKTSVRRDPHYQSVNFLRDMYLAPQTAVWPHMKCLIEHIQFSIALLMQLMIALHIYLTGCTQRHAPAGAFYSQIAHFADLHQVQIHIGRSIYEVLLSCPIYYLYRNRIFHGCKYRLRFMGFL